MYPDGAAELLKGCGSCDSHFFYFIKKEYADKLNSDGTGAVVSEIQEKIDELNKVDKRKVEKDVREMMGIEEQEEIPVVLDIESIRILKPGKYEIDIVNLFSRKRPLIYKLEEGKYIIDLASTIRVNAKQLSDEALGIK